MDWQKQTDFVDKIWSFYNDHARVLPWRVAESNGIFDSYKILLSEMMLQQTQVGRVIPQYQAFLASIPTLGQLAKSDLAEVMRLWNGLGYNRRAKYLHEAAKKLALEQQPWSLEQLTALKGIGYNTAAAVRVYSYNIDDIFVETNIRTVYLYHFFQGKTQVDDREIAEALKQTIDHENPREFYWALMDYGSSLKKQGIRNNSRSKHYKKQSRFQGSRREVRGVVLRLLTKQGTLQSSELKALVDDHRVDDIVVELAREELIKIDNNTVRIA